MHTKDETKIFHQGVTLRQKQQTKHLSSRSKINEMLYFSLILKTPEHRSERKGEIMFSKHVPDTICTESFLTLQYSAPNMNQFMFLPVFAFPKGLIHKLLQKFKHTLFVKNQYLRQYFLIFEKLKRCSFHPARRIK